MRANGGTTSNAAVLRAVRGVKFLGNNVHNNLETDGGLRVDCGSTDIEIRNNFLLNNTTNGLSIDDAHALRVEGNRSVGNGMSGIDVASTDTSTFDKNDAAGNVGMDLVADVTSAGANTFKDNKCDEQLPLMPPDVWDCIPDIS